MTSVSSIGPSGYYSSAYDQTASSAHARRTTGESSTAAAETDKTKAQSQQVTQNTQKSGQAPASQGTVNGLTDEEQKQVDALEKQDRVVRAHEQAHIAAGGSLVRGAAHYEYTTGPDGKKYASGGEVSIDTSTSSGNPDATIQKAYQIRRAALAPADPSGQDQKVAAEATQMITQAQAEKASKSYKESSGTGDQQTAGVGKRLSVAA